MLTTKVFVADKEEDSDFNVFFVNQDSQQVNHKLIYKGELVKKASDADFKVFIVDKERKAQINILRKNFPR